MTDDLVVRGAATPEEVAAVLALLSRGAAPEPDSYRRWRAGRRAALRTDPVRRA